MTIQHSLDQSREQITTLDNELLALLAKRRDLSLAVARSKEVDVRPIRDTQREKQLLARLVKQGRKQGLDAHYVLSLYQHIIEDSVLNQQAYLQERANPDIQKQQHSIAYLGAKGSYSYLAATRYCERRQLAMRDIGCTSFDEIIKVVESGHADYGFLPIENTSSGSINEVYDILQHTSLAIVGETTIAVDHCLLAKTQIDLKQIKTIYAHPQPISQSNQFLSRHRQIKLEYCSSSAEAMDKVAKNDDNSVVAIGSAEGGALYQLQTIEKNIANQKINQSRFIVVARNPIAVPQQILAKSTLIMATGQKPGALVEALLVLKAHNLNMSKLESRPITGTPWEEMFYLDLEANIASPEMQQALKKLERITHFIKVLGCYPCETVSPTHLSNSQLLLDTNIGSDTDVAPRAKIEDTESQAQPRYSKLYKPSLTQVDHGSLHIGNNQFGVIAQLQLSAEVDRYSQQAKQIKEAGFEAVIVSGLNSRQNIPDRLIKLKQALGQFNLTCIIAIEYETELTHATEHGDLLFISGKQMFNQPLLKRLGSLHMPLILERNTMASIDEFLNAAETILTKGNQQLILCESGIRTFNDSIRPTLDLAGLVNIKSTTHLPVIVNTSYACEASMTAAQSLGAKQLNADGLILSLMDDNTSLAEQLDNSRATLRSLYHDHD